MAFDITTIRNLDLTALRELVMLFVAQLEGPYKWYIMGGVAFALTAFITRFIFKTFKWFLLLLCIAAVMIGGFYFVASLASLK